MVSAKDVDAHVETAPEAARPMLPEVRRTILDAVPSVTEKLGPWMPSYEDHGQRQVHFSAAKAHVGAPASIAVRSSRSQGRAADAALWRAEDVLRRRPEDDEPITSEEAAMRAAP